MHALAAHAGTSKRLATFSMRQAPVLVFLFVFVLTLWFICALV